MNKGRILIVEDEVIIAMEIADRLRSMGYEIIKIVSNGDHAIQTVKDNKPDLILMDIMIQGDFDGIETATRIKSFSDTPVIYLTANADESTLERAKSSDAFGYLIKPFEEKELKTSIEMALYKHTMEQKLKESEERFKSLVENSTISIFRVSREGKVLHGNSTFISLLGFNKLSDLVGKNLNSFVHPDEDEQLDFSKLAQEDSSNINLKIKLISSNNENVIVSLSANPVKWEDEVLYFDGTMVDITKQQKYEEELIAAKDKAEESDRLKTEFLAGMSHEIRTPVNTIMSYLSLLNADLNDSEVNKYKDIFDAIDIGSKRLTRTIDSILNMAQFQSGTFDVFKTKIDIDSDVLGSLIEEFKYTASQRGLDLNYSNCTDSCKILGDKYSLSQMFVNLIDNGLKYTKKGFVNVKLFNDKNGYLSVSVKDSGIGISDEFMPTLFKPFSQEEQGYRRKFDGNGLGLALVKRYCELNDAVIKVNSKKGEGTEFMVKFTSTCSKHNETVNKEYYNKEK